jgi:hypothetical protein
MSAPRQQTQLSMFGYLTGQPRAAAVGSEGTPAHDAGAQRDAERGAADAQRAQATGGAGSAQKRTSPKGTGQKRKSQ